MDVKSYIHKCLSNLKALGIDVWDQEQDLTKSIMGMPSDMLADLEEYQITGLLFDYMDSNKVYSFDTEVANISDMYSVFLAEIETLTDGDLEIKPIKETLNDAALEAGRGTHTIQFQCNQKIYEYKADAYYDWFDTKILSFINQVIKEQKTGKFLLVGSDGWQNCVIFYETEEWMHQFNERMDMQIEKS